MMHHVNMSAAYELGKENMFYAGTIVDFAETNVPEKIWKGWEKAGIIESTVAKAAREAAEFDAAEREVEAELNAQQEEIDADLAETFPADCKETEACEPES